MQRNKGKTMSRPCSFSLFALYAHRTRHQEDNTYIYIILVRTSRPHTAPIPLPKEKLTAKDHTIASNARLWAYL